MTYILTPVPSVTSTAEYFVSKQEAKDMLRLPSVNQHLGRVVESVNDRIVRATGYVPAGTAVTQKCDGGWLYLFLHNMPVIAVTSVIDLASGSTLETADYELRGANNDYLYKAGQGRWPGGQLRYSVTYVAGTDSPPAVLRSVALAMVAREYSVGEENALPPMTQAEIDEHLRDFYRIG